MKFSLIFVVILACVAFAAATTPPKKTALKRACKDAAKGTKIKLEIDLGQGCFGKCKPKRAKKKAPKKVHVNGKPKPNPVGAAPPAGPPAAKGGPPPPPAPKK